MSNDPATTPTVAQTKSAISGAISRGIVVSDETQQALIDHAIESHPERYAERVTELADIANVLTNTAADVWAMNKHQASDNRDVTGQPDLAPEFPFDTTETAAIMHRLYAAAKDVFAGVDRVVETFGFGLPSAGIKRG